jgi:lambda family phage portal protein
MSTGNPLDGNEMIAAAADAVATGNAEAMIGALKELRAEIGRKIAAPGALAQRMYLGARPMRASAGFQPAASSADAELVQSLTNLRARSRQLVRDASYAKRAVQLIVNNVIGTGIGLQPRVMTTRGQPAVAINDDIKEAHADWAEAEDCHTGGRLCFPDIERLAMGEVVEAGEVLVRLHNIALGDSRVPLAIEVIESERLADDWSNPAIRPAGANEVRMGVEVDPRFYRPVAYWIRNRHPSETQWSSGQPMQLERVPAESIIHLSLTTRWPQTRGEPWLHTAIRRLSDMDGYSEAEITRARVQALTPGAIETPQTSSSFGSLQEDGSYEVEMQSGTYLRLNPGEKFSSGPSGAPNPALDPFMRYMVREIAAGIGVSYESLSRDYSQSNYSSSRLALLDDRDVWKHLQRWFIDAFRRPIYERWLEAAALSGAVPSINLAQYAARPEKFEAVQFKPRGWSWVDPTKEVEAAKQSVISGFSTVSDVIAATAGGADLEDVLEERKRELELMAEMGLEFDTSPDQYSKPEPATSAPAQPATSAPAQPATSAPAQPATSAPAQPEDGGTGASPSRLFKMRT